MKTDLYRTFTDHPGDRLYFDRTYRLHFNLTTNWIGIPGGQTSRRKRALSFLAGPRGSRSQERHLPRKPPRRRSLSTCDGSGDMSPSSTRAVDRVTAGVSAAWHKWHDGHVRKLANH